ncbi:MAG TPA: dethiobiotin synthase [Stellaceae bacterium]|nr:dethiobiotin synthase [Stellaceae bacterium]
MSALFLTATGTDIGKTFIAAGLIRELRRRGRAAAALKPVASGFEEWSAPASDPARLLDALGLPATAEEMARIAPWRFRAPLSPDMAAAREGRRIDFAELVAFCRGEVAARADVLLIEGIGGVMVPLDERHTVLDWMAAVGVPALLVAGSYLGTISHSLTALGALRQRGLAVAALVVSETEGSAVPLDDTVASIARFADGVPVVPLPLLPPGADDGAFARIADLL